MRIEDKLTLEQCCVIGERIINRFHDDCRGGTKFGIDWPTMRVLFPTRCRVFHRLRERVRRIEQERETK